MKNAIGAINMANDINIELILFKFIDVEAKIINVAKVSRSTSTRVHRIAKTVQTNSSTVFDDGCSFARKPSSE
jgi:hypothetical protein